MGENNTQGLTAVQIRRLQDRESWNAFWKIRDVESQGQLLPRIRYYVHRYVFDAPITAFREKVVEPLHDRYRPKYYHRKLTRVPDIDMCGVSDLACQFEAQEQYRYDKMVDDYILDILLERISRCYHYHNPYIKPCNQAFEDYEEAEYNWFVKYGELGFGADAKDVYMKQKHRMIWERRHPEIMAERERKLQEHKKELADGNFDHSFWKKGLVYMDKKNYEPPYDQHVSKATIEGDKPLSKDWQYYKKVAQDPEFDKQQGKQSEVRII